MQNLLDNDKEESEEMQKIVMFLNGIHKEINTSSATPTVTKEEELSDRFGLDEDKEEPEEWKILTDLKAIPTEIKNSLAAPY
jgi:hypothetical protein